MNSTLFGFSAGEEPFVHSAAGAEPTTYTSGRTPLLNLEFLLAVLMALCTWIICGPLRRTAIVGLNQVIGNKWYKQDIAKACRLLQEG